MSIIISLISITVIAELFFLIFWVEAYFKKGIIVFKKTIAIKFEPNVIKLPEILSQALSENMWHKKIIFKGISSDEIIFREKLYKIFTYNTFPLIRGYLQINPEGSSVTITGRLNLIIPLLVILIFFFMVVHTTLAAIIFITSLFIFYLLWLLFNQRRRYAQLLEIIAIFNESSP